MAPPRGSAADQLMSRPTWERIAAERVAIIDSAVDAILREAAVLGRDAARTQLA